MSQADLDKWDVRYRQGNHPKRNYPSPFLDAWIKRLPESALKGRALDIACGAGRNALCLAQTDLRVDAMDISRAALDLAAASAQERGLDVNWIEADLDDVALDVGVYNVISIVRFMHRQMAKQVIDALAPDGWLLVEHHLQSAQPVGGPSTNTFRLAPQELLRDYAGLRVLFYEECIDEDRDGRRMALARLVACKGDAGF
ncbi:MAG: tellurite methyltransferase [Gammaproteobacteria bacterium]|jgi:tellurite methyltransferase